MPHSACLHKTDWLFVTALRSRKKDHGRAEAMLIAAWGAGFSQGSAGSIQQGPLRQDVRLDGSGHRLTGEKAKPVTARSSRSRRTSVTSDGSAAGDDSEGRPGGDTMRLEAQPPKRRPKAAAITSVAVVAPAAACDVAALASAAASAALAPADASHLEVAVPAAVVGPMVLGVCAAAGTARTSGSGKRR